MGTQIVDYVKMYFGFLMAFLFQWKEKGQRIFVWGPFLREKSGESILISFNDW